VQASVGKLRAPDDPTHGDQDGSAYNGHFGCTCYHLLFNQFGDLERFVLRPGKVIDV